MTLHLPNMYRTNAERRARYCFLRKGCGFNRDLSRRLEGWTDSHLVQFLKAIGEFENG